MKKTTDKKVNSYIYKIKLILLFLVLSFFLSVGSVFGVWEWGKKVSAKTTDIPIILNKFSYIPDNSIEEVIDIFDDELDKSGTSLSWALTVGGWAGKDVTSHTSVTGDNLRTSMGIPDGIEFALTEIDDNTKYLYLTAVDMGDDANNPNIPYHENVYRVYRITFKNTDEFGNVEHDENNNEIWHDEATEIGYAPSFKYTTGLFGTAYPFFDWKNWHEGTLGTSYNDAIYTFVSDKQTADATSGDVYYKINLQAGQRIRITITSSSSTQNVKIYDEQYNLITENTSVVTLENTNESPALYYIVYSGNAYISYEIVAE